MQNLLHFLNKENTKILICGHSRGAAVADLLAVDLNQNEKYAAHDNIYAYTFATPKSISTKCTEQIISDNIFNINNYYDIIWRVPGGYYSPGTNLYFNNPGDSQYKIQYDNFIARYNRTNNAILSSNKKPYTKCKYSTMKKISAFTKSEHNDLITGNKSQLADIALQKNSSSNSLFSGIGESISQHIGCNHAMETYMCWLEVDDYLGVFSNKNYCSVSVACPVDVTMTDGAGNIISKIVNNQIVTYTGPYCEIEGDTKVFYMPEDSGYNVSIVGNDNGEMSVVNQTCQSDGSIVTNIGYTNIPVVKDDYYTLTADESAHTVLTASDGTVISPDYDSSKDEYVTISIDIIGSGNVLGEGQYSPGESVTLKAVPDEGSQFTGWYLNNELVSTEATYSFICQKDGSAIYEARFTSPEYSKGDINADDEINAVDALQALRHSVSEITLTGDAFTRGDVYKDNKVDATDALQILRYSVKEILSF